MFLLLSYDFLHFIGTVLSMPKDRDCFVSSVLSEVPGLDTCLQSCSKELFPSSGL